MGSVAVSKNGEIIYLKSVGYADINNKIKANNETKYRIGSISKSFTAILVLKAIENKKLELNQTIDKWFPTIKNSEKISVKQLLNHRSGIYNFTDNLNYLTWNTQKRLKKKWLKQLQWVEIVLLQIVKQNTAIQTIYCCHIFLKNFMKSYSELMNEYY